MQPPEFSILNTKKKLNKQSKLNSFLTFLGNKQRIELYKDPQMKKQRQIDVAQLTSRETWVVEPVSDSILIKNSNTF